MICMIARQRRMLVASDKELHAKSRWDVQMFTIKMSEGILASAYSAGDKFYIDPYKLLPLDRFLPQPKGAAGAPRPFCSGLHTALSLSLDSIAALAACVPASKLTQFGVRRAVRHCVARGHSPLVESPSWLPAQMSCLRCGTYPSSLLVACRCLLYTSPSPRDRTRSRMPSSA